MTVTNRLNDRYYMTYDSNTDTVTLNGYEIVEWRCNNVQYVQVRTSHGIFKLEMLDAYYNIDYPDWHELYAYAWDVIAG